MKYPKRSQYKYTKKTYRVRNWRAYEEGLCRRGDLTIWLSEEALKAWKAPASGKPGGGRPAKIVIPPKRDALLSSDPVLKERNRHIRSVEKVGRRKWQTKSGYTRRSMVENAIYRYKSATRQCWPEGRLDMR